jgi:ABC-type antimicrobial peptide transport system permease subunit
MRRLYGVTAYRVASRTGEIGIRTAPGVTEARVIGIVVRDALLPIGCGVAFGLPAALAGGRLLNNQLYGVKSHDPLTLAGATVQLTCALMAALVPARRATRVNPMQALRAE